MQTHRYIVYISAAVFVRIMNNKHASSRIIIEVSILLSRDIKHLGT